MTEEQKQMVLALVEQYKDTFQEMGITLTAEEALQRAEKNMALHERAKAMVEWEKKQGELANLYPYPDIPETKNDIIHRGYRYYLTDDPEQNKALQESLKTEEGRKAFYQRILRDFASMNPELSADADGFETALTLYEKNPKMFQLGFISSNLNGVLQNNPQYQPEEPLKTLYADKSLLLENTGAHINQTKFMARPEFLIFPDIYHEIEPEKLPALYMNMMVKLPKEEQGSIQCIAENLPGGTSEYKDARKTLFEKGWHKDEVYLVDENGNHISKAQAISMLNDPENKTVITEKKYTPQEMQKINFMRRQGSAIQITGDMKKPHDLDKIYADEQVYMSPMVHSKISKSFLLDNEVYDSKTGEELQQDKYGAQTYRAIGNWGYDTGREYGGVFLVAAMAGQRDPKTNKPLYSLEDILNSDKLIEEKKAFGKKIREDMAALPTDATPEEIKKKEEIIREIDLAIIRGTDVFEQELNGMVKEALQAPGYSGFINAKLQTVAHCYVATVSDLTLKHKGVRERFNKLEESGPVTESGRTFEQLVQSGLICDVISNFTNYSKQARSTALNVGKKTTISTIGTLQNAFLAVPYLDALKQRLAANPNISLPDLLNKQERDMFTLGHLSDEHLLSDLEENEVSNFFEDASHEPQRPLIDFLVHIKDKPLLLQGAYMMIHRGTFGDGSSYTHSDGKITSMNCVLPSDQELLREVYLSRPIPVDEPNDAFFPGRCQKNREVAPDSEEAIDERYQLLRDSLEEINRLESAFRTSDEWKLMKESLEKAVRLSGSLGEDGFTNAEKMQLDAAMQELQQRTSAYMEHKIQQRGLLESSKDMARLDAVKKLNNIVIRESVQTQPMAVAAKESLKESPFATENLSAQALVFYDAAEEMTRTLRTGDGSSAQFTEMVKSLRDLSKSAADMTKSNWPTAAMRQEYVQKLQTAQTRVDAYLDRKKTVNNGSMTSLQRIDLAKQMKELMGKVAENIQEKAKDLFAIPHADENTAKFSKLQEQATQILQNPDTYQQDGTVKPEMKNVVRKSLYTLYTAERARAEQNMKREVDNGSIKCPERWKPAIDNAIRCGKGVDVVKHLMEKDINAEKYLSRVGSKADVDKFLANHNEGMRKLVKHIDGKIFTAAAQKHIKEEQERMAEIEKNRDPVRQAMYKVSQERPAPNSLGK